MLAALGGPLHLARGQAARERLIDLREVAQLAKSATPIVQSAERRVRSARARREVARGAYFPVVSGQADYGGFRQQQLYFVPDAPNQKSDATGTRATVDGRLEWLVSDFGGRRAELSRSEHEHHAARHGETQVRFASVRAASEYYVELLTTQRLRDNAALSVQRRTSVSSAIARLIEAGLRPRVDLQRAEIEAVAARAELAVLGAQASAQSAKLAAAMGLDPASSLRAAELGDALLAAELPEPEAIGHAERRRPELPLQRARVEAGRSATRVARARLLPSLSLFLSASFQHDAVHQGSSVDGSAFVARAGVALRLRALDVPTVRTLRVAEAELALELSLLREQALRTREEVVASRRELTRAQEALAQAEQILEAAHSTRDAQHRRYEAGEASLLELLDAEAVEQDARSRRIFVLRDLEVARIALLDAMGLLEARLTS